MVVFTDADRAEIIKVLKEGGSYSIRIAKTDIAVDDFEDAEEIRDKLYTGFRLDPNWALTPMEEAQVNVYGDGWTVLMHRVYKAGGEIVYRKISDQEYEATIEKIADAPQQ